MLDVETVEEFKESMRDCPTERQNWVYRFALALIVLALLAAVM